ncbi:MAG TPA: TetR family transcriptional regulator [Streptosporangiaceae bacterium]|nr:TetR family transcriptional regulator [Streptosporangiaceae bacterium]
MSVAQDDRCEPGGLRERKKAATRRALGIAAMRLAVQRGLDNVLVEDIAAEAGVSTRTFNNYFASKYEAICALAMERGRLIGVALRNRPAAEPLMEAIANAVLHPYSGSDRTPDKEWIEGVRLVVRSPALQGEYLRTQYAAQQTLAQAIADRIGADLETDMFPAVMAGAVAAAMQVALERWLRSEPPVALVPLLREALGELRWPLITREDAESEFSCDRRARPPKLAQAARRPPTAPPPTPAPTLTPSE